MPRGLGYHSRCSPEPRGAKTSTIEPLIEEEKRGGTEKNIGRREKKKNTRRKKTKRRQETKREE